VLDESKTPDVFLRSPSSNLEFEALDIELSIAVDLARMAPPPARPPATVSVVLHTTRAAPRGNHRQCTLLLIDQAAEERLNSLTVG